MIDNRVQRALGKYTLINRTFLLDQVNGGFTSLSLVQNTRHALISVALRCRVTPLLASKTVLTAVKHVFLSLAISVTWDIWQLFYLTDSLSLFEAFTTRPYKTFSKIHVTEKLCRSLFFRWMEVRFAHATEDWSHRLFTWHSFRFLLFLISQGFQCLSPRWPRGVDDSTTWDCCWKQQKTLQELLRLSALVLRWELFENTRFRFNGVCIANNPTTRSERIRKFEMYTPHQKGLQMTRPMKCKNLISLSLNIIGENIDVRIILILLVLDYMLHNLP